VQDATGPTTPADLFAYLDSLAIATSTIEHAPVFTVEQAKEHRGELEGGHCKSLFLRDKKGRMWLVVTLEDRQIDLKALPPLLGSGRLSFGSAERLMTYLGVIPGAVTPFAVVNDVEGHVGVALDEAMLESDPLNYHPLDNAMTTAISPTDLLRFLHATGHAPQILDLDAGLESNVATD
jgi:Ala-tRNA(Pro) deacylase